MDHNDHNCGTNTKTNRLKLVYPLPLILLLAYYTTAAVASDSPVAHKQLCWKVLKSVCVIVCMKQTRLTKSTMDSYLFLSFSLSLSLSLSLPFTLYIYLSTLIVRSIFYLPGSIYISHQSQQWKLNKKEESKKRNTNLSKFLVLCLQSFHFALQNEVLKPQLPDLTGRVVIICCGR